MRTKQERGHRGTECRLTYRCSVVDSGAASKPQAFDSSLSLSQNTRTPTHSHIIK